MKKVGTIIISIVMFFSILSFTALFSLRNVFSKNGISEILNVGFEDIEINSLIDDIFNSNEDTKDLGKYIDTEEFSEAFTDYIADYLIYTTKDNGKQPSSEKMKEIISKALKKYEKENNVTIDDDIVDEMFDAFDKDMEESKTEVIDNNEVKLIFGFIYSNNYLIALGVSIVCLILIFVINLNIKSVCTSLGIISIINGFIVFLMSLVLKIAVELEDSVKQLGDVISSPFKTAAIVSIILGVVLLIIRAFIKEKKKEEVL